MICAPCGSSSPTSRVGPEAATSASAWKPIAYRERLAESRFRATEHGLADVDADARQKTRLGECSVEPQLVLPEPHGRRTNGKVGLRLIKGNNKVDNQSLDQWVEISEC